MKELHFWPFIWVICQVEVVKFFSLDKGKVNKSGKVRQKNICPAFPSKSIDDGRVLYATEATVMMINA